MWIHRPAPAHATHHEIVGPAFDAIRGQVEARIDQLVKRVPAYAIETQSLAGPQVVGELQVAIVERDVIGGIIKPAAGEVAQVALARGSQPRPFSRLSQFPFPQQLRVRESDRSSEDWRRTAAIASLQVECSSDRVAIFFGIGGREQLDVLKGLAG